MNDASVSTFFPELSSSEVASLCKALAHPARVQIVHALQEKQSCIGCDLVDELGLAQSTTSEHLRILKQAGIIHGETEHPRVCYRLNKDMLNVLQGWLTTLTAQPLASQALGDTTSVTGSAVGNVSAAGNTA